MSTWRERKALADEALADSRSRFTGTTARCPCPQCEGERGKRDNKLSLTVNLQSSMFYCHRCGLKGTGDIEAAKLYQQTREYLGRDEETKEDSPAVIEGRERAMWLELITQMHDRNLGQFIMPEFWGDENYRGRQGVYALSVDRNAPALIHDWQTGAFVGVGDHAEIRCAGFMLISSTLPSVAFGPETLFHPETLFRGKRHLGWVLRDMTGGQPKYANAKGMNRGELFYNEAALTRTTSEPLIVVEGCFDALSRWPNGIAALGKLTKGQKMLLEMAPRPVLIVPDGDAWEAGRMDAMELAHHGQTAGFLRLPAGKDPDEYDQAAWDKLVAEQAEWF